MTAKDLAVGNRDIGPLLIRDMYEGGVIEDNIFSFYMEGYYEGDYASFLDIGQIDNSHMRNPDDLIWLDLQDHMFWMINSTSAVRYGDDEDNAYQFPTLHSRLVSVIDSGTSMVFVPNSLWAYFLEHLKMNAPGHKFQSQGQYIATDCNFSTFPSIYL